MSVERLAKRRMALLKQLAEAASFRHDVALKLEDVSPNLIVQCLPGDPKYFADKDRLTRTDNGSDERYDFTTLVEQGLIVQTEMGFERHPTAPGLAINPRIKVTHKGLAAVAEANKSWLQKAIDKQPITFIQVIVTVLFSIASFLLGLMVACDN